MDDSLAQQAINAALKGEWGKAVQLNLQILKSDKVNIDALNRLARSYFELNKLSDAKKTANIVLKNDPFNTIAQKSLEKWSIIKSKPQKTPSNLTANAFLEESGKTKTVSLIHLGDKDILAGIDSGDIVNLNIQGHRICVTTAEGCNVGKVPDDVSIHLKKLMKLGYTYSVYVKSIDPGSVKIFIKETHRPSKYLQMPSFTSEKFNYVSYTPPELVHDKPNITYTGEEDDSVETDDSSLNV